MNRGPVLVATHPRACSTAFERVFMTRPDELCTFHEPFGDPWHFGPERLSERFKDDLAACEASGESRTTFKDVLDRFKAAEKQGKRPFVKDMAYYLFAPDGQSTTIAPSLGGGQEAGNPTVLPLDVIENFHFTFLIRHPRRSIPSFYRCTVPPLSHVTGFDVFMPNEAGYEELVRLINFLIEKGILDKNQVTVIDADDLLDNPEKMLRKFCERTGIEFKLEMLEWGDDREYVKEKFAKWNGFHDDAIESSCLKARDPAKKKTTKNDLEDKEWAEKYGAEAQKVIRETVDANVPYYEYLKQFCLTV